MSTDIPPFGVILARHEICHPDRDRAIALWNARVDTYLSRHLAYEAALDLLRKQ